ncbi:MAG TPA: sensor histidine kinase, partial [Anaerolineae bacterium]|nr:sensor histidine kinase [Anaerolineae bacterium]
MSIRLRLTLLYSLILALTLVAFSVILYVTQARTTLNDTKEGLARRADYLIEGPLNHQSWDKAFKPDPSKLGTFTQICNFDGQVLGRSPNLGDTLVLPLGQEGLQAARRGETRVEIAEIETERLLIHNQPFHYGADETPLILQIAASLAEQDQNLDTLGRILIIGSSLAVIAAFGIGWLLAGLTLRPINR